VGVVVDLEAAELLEQVSEISCDTVDAVAVQVAPEAGTLAAGVPVVFKVATEFTVAEDEVQELPDPGTSAAGAADVLVVARVLE